MNIGDLFLSLRIDSAEFQKSVGGISSMALGAIGIVGVAIAGLGVKAAMEWETAFLGVRKTVDASEADFDILEGQLRDLAGVIPLPATELARLAETAGALGIAKGDIAEFVRITAMIGTTTNVSADMAATSLGQLSNVLGLTGEDYERFGSALVDLGNKGASTEQDILAIATRAGGAADLIGIAAAETLGWSSAVANLGIDAEAGGSALQRFFLRVNELTSSETGLAKLTTLTGLTAEEFQNIWKNDPTGALVSIIDALSKLDASARAQALKDLGFNDIRITRMLLGMAGNVDNLTDSVNIGRDAWDKNAAMQVEFEKKASGVEAQLQLLFNDLHDIAITLGDVLLPHVRNFIGLIRGVAQGIGDWMKQNKGLVDTITPILAVLSGILALKWGGNFLGMLLGQLGLRGLGQMLIRAVIPSATIAGTAAGGAQATAHATAATGPGLVTRMVAALMRTAPFTAAAAALGTAIGAAQAAAHSAAATGASVVSGLVAKVAAMSIPLAGAGTTVGTAAGSAMAAGVTAGWLVAIGAGAGAVIFGPRLLLEKLTGNDEEGKLRGQTLAYAVSEGFSAAAGSGAGDAMVAAVVAAVASGATREEAYAAGEAAAIAFLNGWVEPWTGGGDNTSGMDAFNSYMDQLAELGRAGGTAAGAATATTWVAKVVEVLAGEGKAHMASAGLSLTEALSRGTTSADASRWMFSAAEQLSSMLKDFLSPEGQGLELIGKKYTKLVAEGVKSGSPDAVRVAQQFAIDSIAAIENAGLEGKKGQQGLKAIGSYFVSLMSSGMDANTAVGRLAGAGVSLETIEGIKTKYPQFFTAGSGATSEFADGTSSPGALSNSRTSGTNVAQAFIAGIASFLHSEVAERRVHDAAADATSGIRGQSPPKVGPLRFIDKWGENIGAAWLDGVKKGIGGVGPLLTAASGMAFNMGPITSTGKLELHHTVDIRGDAEHLDNRKVADMLNDGASGFAWNLEHAMSAVTSG